MITSHSRGHQIIYLNNQWVYKDNRQITDNNRPCKKCGRKPTNEGYDACLGKLDNVTSACCGHGTEEKITVRK